MRLLLDTHAWLWWMFGQPQLSRPARAAIADPDNEVLVSAASVWEIATKHRLGRLDSAATLLQDVSGWLGRAGFAELPICIAHARKAGAWAVDHRDPFDRMLAAQSALDEIPLVSRDAALDDFGIARFW